MIDSISSATKGGSESTGIWKHDLLRNRRSWAAGIVGATVCVVLLATATSSGSDDSYPDAAVRARDLLADVNKFHWAIGEEQVLPTSLRADSVVGSRAYVGYREPYEVGSDIEPGTYWSVGNGDWARLDASGNAVEAGDPPNGETLAVEVVTILPTDAYFVTHEMGHWVPFDPK